VEDVIDLPLTLALTREERRTEVHGAAAILKSADVAFHKVEVGPLRRAAKGLDLIEVMRVAGGEVIETNDPLVEFEQRVGQITADEVGDAGDESGCGDGFESLLQLLVPIHDVRFPQAI